MGSLFDFLVNVSSEVIVGVSVFVYMWARRKMRFRKTIRRILSGLLSKKKFVLLWNDVGTAVGEQIAKELRKKSPRYKFVALENAEELLSYPLKNSLVELVILIDTDVTKLSDKEEIRGQIQHELLAYVRGGGMIFGTHDVIYRRVRNEELARAFECTMTSFKREEEPIEYVVVPEQRNHKIVQNLPETFCLDDGEVCWGSWPQHATVLFESTKPYDNGKTIPLLVLKSYSEGHLIWMNSGDKDERLCESIAKPSDHFIQVIVNALEWKSAIPDVSVP